MALYKKIQDLWFGPGRGDIEPPPAGSFQRLWFVIRSHYLDLIGLNLLVLALCLPVVTIPAALSGMTHVLMKWVRDDLVFFWQDFFAEFKANFFKRLLVWLLLVIAPFSLYLYTVMFGFEKAGPPILLLTGAFSALFQSYLFPIFVSIDVPVTAALKNAVLVSILEWKTSLFILAGFAVIYLACSLFILYVIPVIVICLISLWGLVICNRVNEPVRRRLALP
jgi:uncharacterized membrane protein YesL